MGNWRNRQPHRFFNRRGRNSRSSYDYDYDPGASPPISPRQNREFIDDGVPSWEKDFCFLIGSVPWKKVVNVKKFMYCQNDILKWDDSANEEAFQNAKNHYWAEINGLPCDVPLPDPDMYIDEINWNPHIDSELIKELEQAFFVPEEEEQCFKVGRKNKKTRRLATIHSEACSGNPGDAGNPWEGNDNTHTSVSLKDKIQNWNHWNSKVNPPDNLKTDDPWECAFNMGNKVVKDNGWGDGGWNQHENNVNQLNNCNNDSSQWKHNCPGTRPVEDKGWGNYKGSSWGRNQYEPRELNNGGNSWKNNFTQDSGTPKDRGWRDSRGHARGWKRWDNFHKEPTNIESKGPASGGWGEWNKDYQKREGTTHQYATGYSAKFQGDDYQRAKCWSGGNNKRRVSFAVD